MKFLAAATIGALVMLAADPARADDADAAQVAKTAFAQGTAFVRSAQWAEALGAFERAESARHHPVTLFNIGACERALGRYTRARLTLERALEGAATNDGQLPASLAQDARAYLAEIDAIAVHLALAVWPPGVRITVDGRPLDPHGAELSAGVLPAGPGAPLPGPKVMIVLEPGAHVLVLSRAGFADAVLRRSYSAGERPAENIVMSLLPASLSVASNVPVATVTLDGIDVGAAPVVLSRPPGRYALLVRKSGYSGYASTVTLDGGQVLALDATLHPEKPSLLTRWWFWTGVGVLVAGAVTSTYFLTRPVPSREEVGGGTLGWRINGQ